MNLGKVLKHLKPKGDQLVTARLHEFLLRNPEGLVMRDGKVAPETKRLIEDIMDRAFGGNSDRSGRFGASSRGTCHRRQMWTFLGMPSRVLLDPDTVNLFNDGKFRHLRWQVMLVQSGAATHAEYRLPKSSKYRLSSSADALNAEEQFLIEFKGDRNLGRLMSADPDAVVSKHLLQIHTMFLMTGWERCVYLMEDKATNDWREVVVYRDPALIHEVRKELEELNEHVERRTLPEPLPACQAKEGPYRSCPFAGPCIERWRTGNHYWPDVAGDWDS